MAYPANPNPARITNTVWWFRCDALAIEQGTNDEDSGIYAEKAGYHGTRDGNDPDNYSVRDAPDKKGPDDKAAAWDWTFRSAQNGDYSRISIYGKRMLKAWEEYDPRCNVLREFLGQTDTDAPPEGIDFRYHTKRQPDDSHKWHIHFSFVRAYVAIVGALDGVLSVLKGESLDAYLDRGGKLYYPDGTGEMDVEYSETQMKAFPWQYQDKGEPTAHDMVLGPNGEFRVGFRTVGKINTDLARVEGKLDALIETLNRVIPAEGESLNAADHVAIVEDVKTALRTGTE